MTYSGTGHRLNKLGGYDPEIYVNLINFLTKELSTLKPIPTKLILGMAIGFDQACARAAINLTLPFEAAVPFVGQEKLWPKSSQQEFYDLLELAATVTIVSEGIYHPSKMIIRNHYMVDHSQKLISLYNGDKNGGTFECVKYAEKQCKEIINLYDKYLTWMKS